MAKPEIQEEIAHLLMKNSVGLTENAIIQQVTSTANVKAINSALSQLKRFGYIKEAGKRWEITPIGRAYYSDMNSQIEVKNELAGIGSEATQSDTSETDAGKTGVPGIEITKSFRTPDGELFGSLADAEEHMNKQQLRPRIDKFIEWLGSPTKQKGIIISYITRWEQFNREQSA